jgi:hypothetical protein
LLSAKIVGKQSERSDVSHGNVALKWRISSRLMDISSSKNSYCEMQTRNYTCAATPHNVPADASDAVLLLVNNTEEAPIEGI